MIKIQRATNGWILRNKCEDEPEDVYVFDMGETEEQAALGFVSLCYIVKSLIGPQESRYSAHRVMIHIEPGDKHSSHPDNQEDAE